MLFICAIALKNYVKDISILARKPEATAVLHIPFRSKSDVNRNWIQSIGSKLMLIDMFLVQCIF